MNTPYYYVINDLQHLLEAIEAREKDRKAAHLEPFNKLEAAVEALAAALDQMDEDDYDAL